MYTDLPKLFGRDFVFGYYVPATLLVSGCGYLLVVHDVLDRDAVWDFAVDNSFFAIVVFTAIVFMFAAGLMAFNGWIIRFMEGYLGERYLGWRTAHHRASREELAAHVADCQRIWLELEQEGKPVPPELIAEWVDCAEQLAKRYPSDAAHLLPFKFGNVVRAFEVYSSDAYGLEATVGWPRLLVLIPDDYRAIVDGAKAQVDFMLNLWVAWWSILWLYVGLVVYSAFSDPSIEWQPWWIVPAAVAAIWSLTRLSRGAAMRWGELIKSAFDVYLPELRERLCLSTPASAAEEREMWEDISRSWVYVEAGVLEALYSGRRDRSPGDAPDGGGSSTVVEITTGVRAPSDHRG